VPALFQPSPILQVQHLCLHLSTLKHRREWLADAVLATDPVSDRVVATTALAFVVRVSPEGAMEMRIAG
jgi:hypothetical protein